MHRSAATVITTPDVHPFVTEIVKRDRLVPLSGHMDDIDSVVVTCLNVSSIFKQEIAKLRVAFKRGKVEGCKAVSRRFKVDPIRQRLGC